MTRQHRGDPHKNHPSLNCYKQHGCKCSDCTQLNADAAQRRRDNLSEGQKRRRKAEREIAASTGLKRVRRENTKPLGEEELTRLRRAVGLIR